MPEAVLVSAVRTPVGRAQKGALSGTRPDDLAAIALTGALDRLPTLDRAEIDDVILGCAQQEGEQSMNLARWAGLLAGLPVEVPGVTVNRLCASGLEAIVQADLRLRAGDCCVIIAGGVESMSLLPFGGLRPSPSPWLAEHYPAALLSMGLTAERVAHRFQICREDQDVFAFWSHQKALAAQAAGRFSDELIPVPLTSAVPESTIGRSAVTDRIFVADEGPRADTSLDALAKLKPAFHAHGSVTAGNSSQTSDGAAATVLMEADRARELGIPALARLVSYAVTGCLPEEMGIGPLTAIPKALRQAGLTLNEIGLIELNEAFAAPVLAILRVLDIDPSRVNVNGGAIALGHPLGCTGAKLTATLLAEMRRRQIRYGMVTMCVGGGMGAAAIFERLK
ncbi:MAG: acetyl-CoA C-acyltransferase [Terracidiphilus sp.]